MNIMDHKQPTITAVDRAVPGPDRPDNRAFDPDPEPFNRRGRRFIAREIRRSDRQIARGLRLQELDERSRHGLAPR